MTKSIPPVEPEPRLNHSLLVHAFSTFVEWGKKLSLSYWLFKESNHVFTKIELLMVGLNVFFLALLFNVQRIPAFLHPLLYVFFCQRLIEFLVVYSRNFIFKRGRIYAEPNHGFSRSAWLMLMFSLSVMQNVFVFSNWFRLLSLKNPAAFSHPLTALDSLYFSAVTFLTIGYGDIIPVSDGARLLVILQGMLTFYTVVIVINGLVFSHFGTPAFSDSDNTPKPR